MEDGCLLSQFIKLGDEEEASGASRPAYGKAGGGPASRIAANLVNLQEPTLAHSCPLLPPSLPTRARIPSHASRSCQAFSTRPLIWISSDWEADVAGPSFAGPEWHKSSTGILVRRGDWPPNPPLHPSLGLGVVTLANAFATVEPKQVKLRLENQAALAEFGRL